MGTKGDTKGDTHKLGHAEQLCGCPLLVVGVPFLFHAKRRTSLAANLAAESACAETTTPRGKGQERHLFITGRWPVAAGNVGLQAKAR